MFGLFKRKKNKKSAQPEPQAAESQIEEQQVVETQSDVTPTESPTVEATPADAISTEAPATVDQTPDASSALSEPKVIETPVQAETTSVAPEVENTASAPETLSQTEAIEPSSVAEESVVKKTAVEAPVAEEPKVEAAIEPTAPEPVQEKPKKTGFFARIKAGLGRTRSNLTEGLASLFLGKKQIDDDLLEELETQLLVADIGVEATAEIIDRLTDRVQRKQLADAQALYQALKDELRSMLEPANKPLVIDQSKTPYVILMVGVNGVGKTTTIGKLAKKFQSEGKSVMLAAGDTFRAAAVEQLQVWGERNKVPVIAQHTGADSASVIFDAIQAAKARNVDVLIADTAGRLQNKSHLMEELKKVTRVMKKLDDSAPHETMLVVDAGTGQNALSQASLFDEAVGLTGITLTKLDGTAKGGIVFALAKQMEIPIRYIGVGEQVDDLRPFDADQFTNALFDQSES
jgi:fused signal recognition particle receptor